jgi:D-3-phosphoglycerate dehydrogenase
MRQFERMRPGALLINTSRGGLIDQQALLQALKSEQLGGAALDVFEPEPPDLREPLFAHPRLMATPHAAFVSEQSLLELRRTAAEQIVSVLRGEIPHNVINPSVLTRPS